MFQKSNVNVFLRFTLLTYKHSSRPSWAAWLVRKHTRAWVVMLFPDEFAQKVVNLFVLNLPAVHLFVRRPAVPKSVTKPSLVAWLIRTTAVHFSAGADEPTSLMIYLILWLPSSLRPGLATKPYDVLFLQLALKT